MKILVKILFVTLWLAIAAAAVFLLNFSITKNDSKQCKGISCSIDYQSNSPLISETDLLDLVATKYGDCKKKRISEVNLIGISLLVNNNPYLIETDVLLTVEGNIQINATQCNPCIRLINENGKQFYISYEGRIMPVNLNYPVKTLIATGEIINPLAYGKNIFNIPENNTDLIEQLTNVYNSQYLAKIITSDSILNSLIEQIHILPSGKLQLITKAGSHLIQFGDTTLAAEKLDNLKHFYKNALVKTGWNKYSVINMEYKNQVVCYK